MPYRIWIFIAGLLGLTAVIAGALGAHVLKAEGAIQKAYSSAQLFHALHTLAILGVAAMLAATAGRRNAWAGWTLQAAAFAFLGGILLFSAGIYAQVWMGANSNGGIVPAGGMLFMAGWTALALSAFGLGRD